LDARQYRRRWTVAATLLAGLALFLPPVRAGFEWLGASPQQLQIQAEQCEDTGQWATAAELWCQLLVKDRSLTHVRQHHQYCLRRALQLARQRDPSFRGQIAALSLDEALRLYGEVLSKLQAEYVDPARVQLPQLFRHGLEEFRQVLSDETLRQTYFSAIPVETLRGLDASLVSEWTERPIRKIADVQNMAREIALSAKKTLGVKPSLVVLEFACGACNALDECTYYLTPRQFSELNAALKGEAVGIGVDLNPGGEIAQVIAGSPAQANGLKKGDRILRIGNKSTVALSPEAAAELLKGDPETSIEVEIAQPGDMKPHALKLKRQIVRIPSVYVPDVPLDRELRVGYLQLLTFQETTVEELNLAIEKLQAQGMRALVLDLRGNPGGLFDVARQVVERFVSAGVIVSTQGRIAGEYNATYHAQGTHALAVPLVVLVDGETASSAEMVAGALKDNLRGKLVGKTTFGKGSIQKIKGLGCAPAGIRLTVARFYSPRQQGYDGIGVAPNLDVEYRAPAPMSTSATLDSQLQAALEIARSYILGQKLDGGAE
jgi:carboxyl-terminal processing protease